MTKKHFAAIAAVLAKHGANRDTCEDMARALARFNPNFDEARFLAACGHA